MAGLIQGHVAGHAHAERGEALRGQWSIEGGDHFIKIVTPGFAAGWPSTASAGPGSKSAGR